MMTCVIRNVNFILRVNFILIHENHTEVFKLPEKPN